jgi:serine/threonine-protein kinase
MGSKTEKTLGGFVVEGEIGEGGMGVVLLARQESLDRPVVLKRLRKGFNSNPELMQRFEREAKAAAAIHHQNVVAVYDSFTYRNDLYIAQEYVEGVDLRGVLSGAARIPPRIATCIILELLRGLEEIHYRGTVHRDLKPANVLLGREGDVKIADFGIALDGSAVPLTLPGVVLGSPPYMAPEQLLGETVGPRSDLFAVGVLFYEMLTGTPPFREAEGKEQGTLLGRILREEYTPVRQRSRDVPRRLARLIRSCLRYKRKQRIASASVLRQALERWLGESSPPECRAAIAGWLAETGIIEPPADATVVAPVVRAPRRHRHLMRATAAILVLGALVGGTLFVTKIDIRPLLERLPFVESR